MNPAPPAPRLLALADRLRRLLNRRLAAAWAWRGLCAALGLVAACAVLSRLFPLEAADRLALFPALALGGIAAGLLLGRRDRIGAAEAVCFADRRLGRPGRLAAAYALACPARETGAPGALALGFLAAADEEAANLSARRLARLRWPLSAIFSGLLAAFSALVLLFPPEYAAGAGDQPLGRVPRLLRQSAQQAAAAAGSQGRGATQLQELARALTSLADQLEQGNLDPALVAAAREAAKRARQAGARGPAVEQAETALREAELRLNALLGNAPPASPPPAAAGSTPEPEEPAASARPWTQPAGPEDPAAWAAHLDYRGLIAREVPERYRGVVIRYCELFFADLAREAATAAGRLPAAEALDAGDRRR